MKLGDHQSAEGGLLFATNHFEVRSDVPLHPSVVFDFMSRLEAAYLALKVNPIGLAAAKPLDKRYKVSIYSSEKIQDNLMGVRGASVIYNPKFRWVRATFNAIGVEQEDGKYRAVRPCDPSVIQEVVRELTYQWQSYFSDWLAEGLADYVSSIPFTSGSLNLGGHERGMVEQIKYLFGNRTEKLSIYEPSELIKPGSFSGGWGPTEKRIHLQPIQPVRLEPSARPAFVKNRSSSMEPPGTSPQGLPASDLISMTNYLGGSGRNYGKLSRHSSAMLLLHDLLKSNQGPEIRRYLFQVLDRLQERERYIREYNTALNSHHANIRSQHNAWNAGIRRYNQEAEAYNEQLAGYQNGEISQPPSSKPVEPKIPDPVPVPEILAKPRTAEELGIAEIYTEALSLIQIPDANLFSTWTL